MQHTVIYEIVLFLFLRSTFSFVDKEGTCFPATLYNLRTGCGVIVGDTVAIPEPYVQSTDFSENDKVNLGFNNQYHAKVGQPYCLIQLLVYYDTGHNLTYQFLS